MLSEAQIAEISGIKCLNENSVHLQWLIFNDCVFRTRNIYEYVMFHDRDEFVHFVGFDKPRQVRFPT